MMKSSIPIEYSIHVNKNIPLGSGLGGGSSDAATTLKVLNKLWKLKNETGYLRRLYL